jgi:hypothetical protein
MRILASLILSLTTTYASAQSIVVTAQLIHDGEILSNYSGVTENGHQLEFKDSKYIETTDSAKQDGRGVTTENVKEPIGLQVVITPRIYSDGQLRCNLEGKYTVASPHQNRMYNMALESPTLKDYLVPPSYIGRTNEPQDIYLGGRNGHDDYILKITAKAQ